MPARFLACCAVVGCLLAIAADCVRTTARPGVPSTEPLPAVPTRTISGRVLDAASNAPIPAVWVQHYLCRALTNEQGYFTLTTPDYQQPDALWVSTLYYEGRVRVPSSDSGNVILLLKRNGYRFRATTCAAAADSVQLHPYATRLLFGRPGEGWQSFYFENARHRPLGYLRTITFAIKNIEGEENVFRLRIYSVDSLGRTPGPDLLTENVLLCLFRQHPPRTTAYVTYDISEFNIPVPARGFYLGLEPTVGSDAFQPCQPELPNYSPTGPVLRPPCTFADCRTWTWKNTQTQDGGTWTSATENCWPLYEEALSVEAGGSFIEPPPEPAFRPRRGLFRRK